VLAPLVGEYLNGNTPIQMLPALPFLVPLYGAGALLVREVARRTSGGWPAIFLPAAAYGVIEAGLVDQTMFNPSFEDRDATGATYLPAIGVNVSNAVTYLAGHIVWSVAVPIALVESLVPARRHSPWLGRAGLALTAATYLLGCYLIFAIFADVLRTEHFLASPGQRIGAAVVALALIAAAVAAGRKRQRTAAPAGSVPRPWQLGVGVFVASSVVLARPENWYGVLAALAVVAASCALIMRWSRRPGWDIRHEFALAAGALMTYAWTGFAVTWMFGGADPVRFTGNAIFAASAALFVTIAGRRVFHGQPQSTPVSRT